MPAFDGLGAIAGKQNPKEGVGVSVGRLGDPGVGARSGLDEYRLGQFSAANDLAVKLPALR